MSSKFRHLIASAFCAMAALFAAPAQATLVVGSWDPPFGAPFAELGWRGEAVFYVADDCKTVDGVRIVVINCSPSKMKVQSAHVELYNINDPSPQPTKQVLDFTGDMWLLAAHFDSAGVIDGISAVTNPFLMEKGLISEAKVGGNDVYFSLAFEFLSGGTTAHLGYAVSQAGIIQGWNNGADYPAAVTLQIIELPEPASIALVLGALGAAGFATRRRRG
ncbi:PEP-CTERM sorting domain-containing protein [Roseateles violae]|uniref:PEP-CTERM sorting domain-containing protein n=1 Tax=Roseateles violae TaxID=3058042 RepID=A0ABT8DZY2_9BURK|nr:PEP-CTERM sorting domain-containing protein [Pelomonas sp. PFR6]MDN3923113.1 PEP-CTERM sorting domain-containing protein [Pelomonas sp. PFR6]